jgi:K+-dependent Na+/Ca+ exchanger-like protein
MDLELLQRFGTIALDIFILLACFYFLARIIDDLFLDSLDNISKTLKLTPSIAGATIMAFGTSAPEISTTLFALFLTGANPATGLGTVVGSAIFQILVVIGFAALVKTAYLDWKPVIRDGVVYAISVALLIFVVQDNFVTFEEALLLVGGYVVYLIFLFLWTFFVTEEDDISPIERVEQNIDRKGKIEDELSDEPITTEVNKLMHRFSGSKFPDYIKVVLTRLNRPFNRLFRSFPDVDEKPGWTMPLFLISLAGIGLGSYFMVFSGERLAGNLGIPPTIVALTILAGGTSVPELIASAIVSKEGRGDMAISNAIGSNTFDILISLGLPLLLFTAMSGTAPEVGSENIVSSVILLFATVIAVLGLLVMQKFKAGKKFGIVLLTAYVLYVIAAYTNII